ncbi:MAG TPA: fibronectin type III domain-containing protein [Capsulimonadaceae bacterium]|nr:fibronectin type III domain-containing protein [Capsulimonadaceae bacterium]
MLKPYLPLFLALLIFISLLLLATAAQAQTWQKLADPFNANYADQLYAPKTGPDAKLYLPSTGGVAVSADAGATWTLLPTLPNITALGWTSGGILTAAQAASNNQAAIYQLVGGAWVKTASIPTSGSAAPSVTAIVTDLAGNLFAGTRDGGTIWRSADGITWAQVAATGTELLTGAALPDGSVVFGGSAPTVVLKTTDEGATWTNPAPSLTSNNAYFIGWANGLIIGNQDHATGNILWSVGATGAFSISTGLPQFCDVHGFIADSALWMVSIANGKAPGVYQSAPGGVAWTPAMSGLPAGAGGGAMVEDASGNRFVEITVGSGPASTYALYKWAGGTNGNGGVATTGGSTVSGNTSGSANGDTGTTSGGGSAATGTSSTGASGNTTGGSGQTTGSGPTTTANNGGSSVGTTTGSTTPQTSTLSALAVSESEINLTWQPQPTPVTIQRLASDGVTWQTVYSAPAYAAIWTDTSLWPATAYQYRLQNGLNFSTVVSATTQAIPAGAMATPTGLTATVTGLNSVTLAFADTNAAVTSRDYLIERSDDGGATYRVVATSQQGHGGPVVDTPLVPGAYWYRVRASSGTAPASAYTPAVSVTIPALPAGTPNAPTGTTVVNVSGASNTITWTDTNGGAAAYSIERTAWAFGNFKWLVVGTTAAGATSFTDTTCQPMMAYSYRVRAVK